MSDFSDEIYRLNREIDALIQQKKVLISKLKMEDRACDVEVTMLLEYVAENPGTARSGIATIFPELSASQLTNLITKARRKQLIYNMGTKKDPRWYLLIEPSEIRKKKEEQNDQEDH